MKRYIKNEKPKRESQVLVKKYNETDLYICFCFDEYSNYLVGFNSIDNETDILFTDIEWWVYTNEI